MNAIKFSYKHTAIVILLLFAGISFSCGNDEIAVDTISQEEQDFRQELSARAGKAGQEIGRAADLAALLGSLSGNVQPAGPTSHAPRGFAGTGSAQTNAAEIDNALVELAQVESRLKEQSTQPPLRIPEQCEACKGMEDNLRKGISSGLAQIARTRDSINTGKQILAIRETQQTRLKEQVPAVFNENSKEQYMAMYAGQARVYSETMAQWQALAAGGSLKQDFQKVIFTEQKLIELMNESSQDGVTSDSSLEMDRSEVISEAELAEGDAIIALYDGSVKEANRSKEQMESIFDDLKELAADNEAG